ncbi:MAG: type II toxin-antitoxin system PemK/MazF family toxin [Acidobacteria bacterium]|nr:type II toxin-antitoxin system PemK/MazF family toxin [Acidobacteriota bacterium]
MRRGDLFRVAKPGGADPKAFRVFALVSRQAVIDSRFSTVVCAPVYSARHGLASQVAVGPDEGLKHDSALHCDELVSLSKARLTRFVGRLSSSQIRNLDRALAAALDIDVESLLG